MSSLLTACFVEYIKVRRSKTLWLTVAAMCLAPLFGAVFVVVLRDPSLSVGNEALQSKAALSGFDTDWASYFGLIAQAIGVGGVIVFGFVASWMFGREYSDHTMKDMLTLPVSRSTVVAAKFIVCVAWCLIIVATVILVGLVSGMLLRLEGWGAVSVPDEIKHILVTGLLAILLCPPVAFIAGCGRGYLAPIGFVILTVVFAQITAAIGYGMYIPWAIPAIFSGMGALAKGSINTLSYAIVLATSAAGVFGTLYWWILVDQTT